jgi:SAM-dependent methyltransferase
MLSRSLTDVSSEVAKQLQELVKPTDLYHTGHMRRIGRTLDLLLEEAPKDARVLELGTSTLVPIVVSRLRPDIEMHVTILAEDATRAGLVDLHLGEVETTCSSYHLDLEKHQIPVPDSLFDVVLCCEVIEHMEIDPMFAVSEINRATAENGKLILTTPNILSSRAIHKMLYAQEPYFYMQYHRQPRLHRHNYEYSVGALKDLLRSGGFSGRVWTEDCFEEPILDDVRRLRELGYALEDVGDNIFAVMQRVSDVVDRYPSRLYAV